jgi:hypothetical protein
MERRLLKFAPLIAVAVVAGACSPRNTGTGRAQDELPREGPRGSHPLELDEEPPSAPAKGTDDGTPKSSVALQLPARPDDSDRAARDRPSADNTGPSDPEALTRSQAPRIRTDGAVLKDLDLSGTVTIDADNVTLRNFRLNASSDFYGIQIVAGHKGIVIEDGEIFNMKSAGILGAGFTARRLHIHDSGGDGIKAGGAGGPTLVEQCFIEKLGTKPGAHADGNQTRGGSNITFRYNNIWMPAPGTPNYPGAPYKSNAAFMISGEVSDFVIERNWLNGGNYTIYCQNTGGSGVFVRNNRFGRDNGGRLAGKEARRLRAGVCAEWAGNRWDESGGPI